MNEWQRYILYLLCTYRKKGSRKWASSSKQCDCKSDASPLH